MRHLLTLILFALASTAQADPFAYFQVYPVVPGQTLVASLIVNGGPVIECAVPAVDGGVQPKCDLASLTFPGNYSLVGTVTIVPSCTNTPSGAECVAGGQATAPTPFSLALRGARVATPVVRIAP